jgi:hypothetical protein
VHVEQTLGGLDVFLPYVKDYVRTFIGTSITTEQWKDHLYDFFSKNGGPEKIKLLDGVDWDVRHYLLLCFPRSYSSVDLALRRGRGAARQDDL